MSIRVVLTAHRHYTGNRLFSAILVL